MQHNGNAIQLVPPPPLGFPSFQLVHSLAKGIIENLNKVEAELRQNTGVSLVIKQFEKPGSAQDDTSSITTPVPSLATKINDCPGCKNKKQKNDGRSHECKHGIGTASSPHYDTDRSSSPSVSNTVTPDNNNNSNGLPIYDTILVQQTRPRPFISQHGHFMGETSYYCSSLSYSPLQQEKMQLDLVTRSPFALSTPISPPHLTLETQLHLIDVYYTHIHPHLPLINKQDLLLELDHCNQGHPSFLSPLFFYALFARSAPFSTEPHRLYSNHSPTSDQTIDSFATHCLQYANQLRDTYLHQPRISTVFALLLMAVHLEQSKQHNEFSRVWIWAGEAFRMILDLGLHRYNSFNNNNPPASSIPLKSGSSTSSPVTSSTSSSLCDPTENMEMAPSTIENCVYEQFGIRTFWAAFVIDRSISLIYGRPFTLEEKDIDVPLPMYLEQDDQETNAWMATFHDLIDISKIMGRIAKFNYSPHSSERGPIRHQDAMLSTLDSWITSLLKDFSPREEITALSTQQQHLNIIRRLELYTLLILLHRPYIHEHLTKSLNGSSSSSTTSTTNSNSTSRPSLDICSHTAMIITHLVSDIPTASLVYLSKASPIVTYAMTLALRIHLLNASASAQDQKLCAFGEINFEHTLELIRTIPMASSSLSAISTGTGTMLSESVDFLEHQYKQRTAPILSGFTRPYGSYNKYSSLSSPRITSSLDTRFRFTSAQSDCSTSSFDSDHGGSSSKRPYSTENDYFTSGFSNSNSNGSSNIGNTMAKPMQKLKIIEVHPSKGKQKKLKSSANSVSNTSSSDSNNNSKPIHHTFVNNNCVTNTNTATKHRTNNLHNTINAAEQCGPSSASPITPRTSTNSSSESIEPTGETGPTTKIIMTPVESPQRIIIDNNNDKDINTNSMLQTNRANMGDSQQHHFYQESNNHYQQQHQYVYQSVPVYGNSPTSSISSHQSFIPSAGTQGMGYGMNTLFTLGDGLTGDQHSPLLYGQFFASTNEHHSHTTSSMHTTSARTTNSAPMAYDGTTLDDHASGLPISVNPLLAPTSSSLQFPYSSYANNSQMVYASEQTSTAPSTLFIPPSYLPSR